LAFPSGGQMTKIKDGNVEVVSISLEPELLRVVDSVRTTPRSEFIRRCILESFKNRVKQEVAE